jgi:hypothetical protein
MSSQRLLILTIAMAVFGAPALVHAEGLKDEMQAMGRDFKTLRGQVGNASMNSSSLTVVADLEKHTLAAKSLTPPLIAHSPTSEQAKMLVSYRTQIAQLLQQELQLEQDLLDNNNTKATASLSQIHETEEHGHHEFRKRR